MDGGESWTQILAAQGLDLALLAAFVGLALLSFFRKSVRLKYVALAAAVAYMGFVKSRLVSIVDIFAVADWNLPILKYNLAWYALSIFVLVSTVLWGRLYCGRVCAFGALTQLMDAVVPARLQIEIPPKLERRAARIKYGLLVAVVVYYVGTRNLGVYRWVEPFWMFGLFGTPAMWVAVGALLVATVFVKNLYCRFLCPFGAAIGILPNPTVFTLCLFYRGPGGGKGLVGTVTES